MLKQNVELSSDHTQVKIHNTRLHDEGLYSCVAVNPAGNATQMHQLYVGGSLISVAVPVSPFMFYLYMYKHKFYDIS